MQFTFHLAAPRVKKVGDYDDFLVSLLVGMTAVDDNGRSAKLELQQVFPERSDYTEEDPFIPFSDFTPEQILALCETVAEQFNMRTRLTDMLAGPAFKPFAALGPGSPTDIFGTPVTPVVPVLSVQDMDRRIEQARDGRKSGGVQVDVLGTPYWFHSDDASRIQYLGIINFPGELPDIQWKTMSGDFISMTKELAQAILIANLSNDNAIFTVGEMHRAAMAQSADPAAYDFSAGWPAQYVAA